jgi:hypothetical protein
MAILTTERTAAFIPAESPPEVMTAILVGAWAVAAAEEEDWGAAILALGLKMVLDSVEGKGRTP